jgi:hypothetical protein
MVVRIWNVFVVMLWVVSMSALFYRDILPSWQAGAAPPAISVDRLAHVRHDRQAGIFGPEGKRAGTGWVRYITSSPGIVIVQSTTLINNVQFLPRLRILTTMIYRDEGVLDSFETRVLGAPIQIDLKGENYEPDFACEMRAGRRTFRWRMDSESSQMLSEVFRPLAHLPDLHVGQAWQMRVVDPLKAMTDQEVRFDLVLVRVTGTASIEHHGRSIECFVVESDQLKAFVEPGGEVLRQEFVVPVLGRCSIVDELFDEEALMQSSGRVPKGAASRPSVLP